MKYKKIIFDFDGTLFATQIGVANAVKFALQQMNIQDPSEEVLTSFIGSPLISSFKKLGLSKMDAEFGVVKFREYYEEKGHYEAKPYEGMLDIIKELHKEGIWLGIVSTHPESYIIRILLGFLWSSYFHSIRGIDLKGSFLSKDKLIGQVIQDFTFLSRSSDIIMVGDTIQDINGANKNRIESVAVNYGYGKIQDLKDAKPTYIINEVEELRVLLLS